MSWEITEDDDGQPAWSGVDSILNLAKTNNSSLVGVGFMGALIAVPSFFVMIAGGGFGVGFLFITSMIFVLAGYSNLRMPKWINTKWRLHLQSTKITFSGVKRWEVDLKDISRIETSSTREWEKTRDYGAFPEVFALKEWSYLIPDAEYQTFLVLHDTSRRVIYTANADREGCATLAHSIRSYLETVRGTAVPASSSAPVAPPAGFDI